jgi:hypothetical protein
MKWTYLFTPSKIGKMLILDESLSRSRFYASAFQASNVAGYPRTPLVSIIAVHSHIPYLCSENAFLSELSYC